MKVWIVYIWDKTRSSFWFAPTVMAVAAVLLAATIPQLDQSFQLERSEQFGWLTTTVPAARTMLSSLAAAMVTVVSVVFSITMVTLSLTTQQFGPRLLRRFMQNRVTQFSLGAFLATSLYSLLMLRWLDEAAESAFVPHLGIAVAVLMAMSSFGTLIWFIHDTSVSIQAQNVVKSVADDLDAAIVRLFPEELGESPPESGGRDDLQQQLDRLGDGFEVVPAGADGYVEAVDEGVLLSTAQRHNVVLELLARPGTFLVKGQPLAHVWCGAHSDGSRDSGSQPEEDLGDRLRSAFIVGNRRTPRQDLECAVNELVEIAVRALSPGINDPFTAMGSIDWLGTTLTRLAQRKVPAPLRYDESGQLRVIAPTSRFPEVLAAAFNMIRQYGQGSPSVAIRMMETLAVVAAAVRRTGDRSAVRHHADMLARAARAQWSEPSDLADLEERYRRVVDALESGTNHTRASRPQRRPASLDSVHPRPLSELLPQHERVANHSR